VQVPGAETLVNPLRYRGERFDAMVSQYYLRARTYDPATGRFPTIDPFEGVQTHPITQHQYVYAGIDPLNKVDPTGQFFTTTGMLVAANIRSTISGVQDLVGQTIMQFLQEKTLSWTFVVTAMIFALIPAGMAAMGAIGGGARGLLNIFSRFGLPPAIT